MMTEFDRTATTSDPRVPTDATGAVNWGRVGRGTVGTLAFLAVWWAAARGQPTYLLPSPFAVANALRVELASGALFVHLGQSLLHYVPGVTLGVGAGSAVGVVAGWSRPFDDVIAPVVRVLRPIPPLAWIVFAIIWFGLGHAGAAFIVFIGAFWISFYNAYGGVRDASTDLVEVAATLGVTRDRRLLRRVVLPDAAPALLTGLRTSVGQCWMMVVAAELFGAPGIGYEILTSANNLAMERSVAYMLVISAVFVASDWTVQRLEASLLSHRR
jgi:NitT/TauT family transport system permease protein